jgi:hypothetical protein
MATSVTLPHGAKGFDIDEFAIQFGLDKIIALRKSTGEHYTLHAGTNSGVLDVHHTWTDENGQVRHQTLFALRHDDLLPLIAELEWLVPGFLRVVRPLSVGWLHHRHISIVRGLDPVTDEDIAAVTQKRHKRLVISEEKLSQNIKTPDYLEEIWGFPDGAFSLFHRNRRIGIGIKATDPGGSVHLMWIRLRDLRRFISQAEGNVITTVLRYAVPKEQYGNFSMFEP